MTAKDHNKTLGILFLVYGGLNALGLLIGLLMFGGMGAALVATGKNDEQVGGAVFLVLALIIGVISFAFLVPTLMAGFKMLKAQRSSRIWAIVAAILALISFPFGTALGIYALWFLFGDQGKQFYGGANFAPGSYAPPPPPNSWQ